MTSKIKSVGPLGVRPSGAMPNPFHETGQLVPPPMAQHSVSPHSPQANPGTNGDWFMDAGSAESESRWRILVVQELEAIRYQIATLTRDVRDDLACLTLETVAKASQDAAVKSVDSKPPTTGELKLDERPSLEQVENNLSKDTAPPAERPSMVYSTMSLSVDRGHLKETLEAAEQEKEVRQRIAKESFKEKVLRIRASRKDKETFEVLLDSIIGVVICANAVFIGVSMDYDTGDGDGAFTFWVIVDLVFTGIFVFEVLLKVHLSGCGGHFCGKDKKANIFDGCLILIDLLQLLIVLIFPNSVNSLSDTASASLFRVARLLKLSRLLRLLRTEIFKDLVAMISGLIAGLATLGWALVLLFLVVYVFALLFREYLGRKDIEGVLPYFFDVKRAMYTTYRCSFGDCTTEGGAPIFEFVHRAYGWPLSIVYCCFTFFVSVGLFNVISAIFVECTMTTANRMALAKKKERLADDMLWARNIATLINAIFEHSPEHQLPDKLSDSMDEICDLDVPCRVLDQVVKDGFVQKALDNLDIDPDDHPFLSDILDPDNGGTITVFDLLNGIRSLRGEPRRSDIVCIDLMVRSLQYDLAEIKSRLKRVQSSRQGDSFIRQESPPL